MNYVRTLAHLRIPFKTLGPFRPHLTSGYSFTSLVPCPFQISCMWNDLLSVQTRKENGTEPHQHCRIPQTETLARTDGSAPASASWSRGAQPRERPGGRGLEVEEGGRSLEE